MDGKKPFGEYIRKKRLEDGLTQKELADRLYVAESTVSKWERGLSYPDVSLIPAVCKELGISEHEFFMACDDDKAHAQERAARRWTRTVHALRRLCVVGYLVAVVTCLICDLAIFHALDWFWIVLTSVALAFCFTNLPFLVKRNQAPICLGAASGCLLLLLLSCWFFVGGDWIVGSLAIVAVSLALPWGVWALWRYYGRHMAPLSLALTSVWVYGLLAVIHVFTGGGWLLPIAYPITGLGIGIVWLMFAIFYWLPVGLWLKIALCALLATFSQAVINSFCAWMLPEEGGAGLADYFQWGNILPPHRAGDYAWVNIMVFMIMLLVSVLFVAFGVYMEIRRRRLLHSTVTE